MYVDYEAERIRPILHAYFFIAFLLLGLIGQICCELANKATLRNNQDLAIHRMTGWVPGFSFFTSAFTLWNVPGGPVLGLFMLLATVLTPVNTILVGALVKNVQVPSRCDFGHGMVCSTTGPYIFDGPPFNGRPKLVAANAQIFSVANGGLQGIYRKVNASPNFRAQPQDVIANWVCTDVNDDQTYSPGTNSTFIEADLKSKGYLYQQDYNVSIGQALGFEHLVAWSASTSFAPWHIKASIDLSALPTDNMVMRSFHCAVDSPAANEILSAMNTGWTLGDWVQEFQGACYDGSNTPAVSNAGVAIAQILNSMVMVTAGNNNLLQRGPKGLGSDAKQGCLVRRAKIPNVIFALLGIPVVLVVFLALWLVSLVPEAWRSRAERRYVPADLPSWMLHAARERAGMQPPGAPTKAWVLNSWRFGVRQARHAVWQLQPAI